ncbi:hypothetical protein B484DRAFT_426868 [Ochromonadaceae sp. CCMP2298]|nr:hypothetical protein B484DRAFT_426868 [Ochromonadaceae sp. CCMP2298]
MNLLEDHTLMLKVKDGEVEKLNLLYKRYSRRLFGFFYGMTKDGATSEDLVQNVFMRILKYKHTYSSSGDFEVWAFQMARNVHKDHYRKNKRYAFQEDMNPYEEQLSDTHNKEVDMEKADELNYLKKALENLAPEKRELIELVRFQKIKYAKVAEMLGASESAIKKKALELWQDKLADSISEADAEALESFLISNPEVKKELSELGQTWDLFEEIERPEPSTEMDARFDGMMAAYQANKAERGLSPLDAIAAWLTKSWQYQYTLKVPKDVILEAKTVNKGNIYVRDIGIVKACNVNGSVEIQNVNQVLQASTVNGDVTINFLENPKNPIDFNTINGDFNLELPENLNARVYFDSMNGDLFTAFDYQQLSPKVEKIVLLTSSTAWSQDFNEKLVVPLSNPDARGKLEVGQVRGDIKIETYDGKEVIIVATAAGDKDDDCHGCDDDNEKRSAPAANFDLKVSTVHGKIDVKGVNGQMEVSTVHGPLTFTDISGSIVCNTVHGDVTANFKKVSANEPMSFVTLHGNVDVTFPSNVKATTKMKSDRGEIFTDFDMAVENSKPETKSADKGGYKVSINAWVYGEINGGGPEYTMKNMHGDIIIRKK